MCEQTRAAMDATRWEREATGGGSGSVRDLRSIFSVNDIEDNGGRGEEVAQHRRVVWKWRVR